MNESEAREGVSFQYENEDQARELSYSRSRPLA